VRLHLPLWPKGSLGLMELLALSLAILSGVGLAGWNFLTKRSADKQVFLWWMLFLRMLFLLPLFAVWARSISIPPVSFLCAMGSAVLYTIWLALMSRAYEGGDLSLVYPLSRSSQIYVPIWAALFLGERLSLLGLIGITVTCLGVYTVGLEALSLKAIFSPIRSLNTRPSQLALLAAALASVGGCVDKVGVGSVWPFAYTVLLFFMMAVVYSAYTLATRGGRAISREWQTNRGNVLLGGFFGISYMLTLLAMATSAVSYAVSARQTSVVMGTILGVWLLKERYGAIRITSSLLICAGVVMIGLA
jgi:drug/metabolite transporter (DMT)-like permease